MRHTDGKCRCSGGARGQGSGFRDQEPAHRASGVPVACDRFHTPGPAPASSGRQAGPSESCGRPQALQRRSASVGGSVVAGTASPAPLAHRVRLIWLALALALALPGASIRAADADSATLPLSLRLEAQASLGMAGSWLLERQLDNGSWANHPVITSLAALALANAPTAERNDSQAALGKALNFIVSQARPDGGIWNRESQQYPLYSTAISLLALVRVNRPGDDAVLRRGREYLLKAQLATRLALAASDGGFSSGNGRPPNLTESQWAIELLYLTDGLDRLSAESAPAAAERTAATYTLAAAYIGRCQVPLDAPDAERRGSFLDQPGEPNAGTPTPTPGTRRSPAFLTAIGLKSLLYARVPGNDPRSQAALRWLAANASLQSNGDLGEAGYYTYLYSLAKCLRALETAGADIEAAGIHRWRERLVREILRRQNGFGTWRQTGTDWWENRPELVTAYAMLALEAALL